MTRTTWRATPAYRRFSLGPAACRHYLFFLISLVLFHGSASAGDALDRTVSLDIAPNSALDDALIQWGAQTGMQVMMDTNTVGHEKVPGPGIRGTFRAAEALSDLLRGSGLSYAVNDATVTVMPAAKVVRQQHPFQLSQAQPFSADETARQEKDAQTENPKSGPPDSSSNEQRQVGALKEIVVTGTNISGVTETASPITTITREDIDRSGVGTITDFVRLLPANFNGSASDTTLQSLAGGGTADNRVGGSSVNLRGLGSDATLILINGRRVAPGNVEGNFVDISMIPLAAVERVDVVPDGASAIYGSDAVGGVVNFIMRKDFEGAESRARYALADGFHETEAAQTFGHTWGSGSALLSYEYDDRTPLFASDRTYTGTFLEPTTLLPSEHRNSVFLDMNQTASDRLEFFGDAYYSHRSSEYDLTDALFKSQQPSDISSYAATLGGRGKISEQINLEVSGSYAAGANRQTIIQEISSPYYLQVDEKANSRVWSADAKLDGALGATWAGAIRFAVGAQYRQESYDDFNYVANTRFNPERNVTAEFLELQLPLIGPPDGAASPNVLEATAAGRAEHYSDFGSTNNPKVGLIWRPLSGVKFRGTYGTSFKAPILGYLNPTPSYIMAVSNFDPTTGNEAKVLVPEGGNPNLGPEKSTNWTLGIDLQPEQLPGLRTSVTYYNIRFKNLIATLTGSNINIFDALRSETILGSQIIQRNPSLALVQQYLSSPNFFDESGPGFGPTPGGLTPADIVAVVDGAYLNLSTEKTSGVDFSVSYTADLPFGTLDAGVDGTRILKFDSEFASGLPTVSLLNNPYNPVDLRVRGHTAVRWRGLTVAGFINYVNSYSDPRMAPTVGVSSWTTADLTIRYDFDTQDKLLRGAAVQLGVNNITSAEPPYVRAEYSEYPVNYDGANANPIGRIVSIQLMKRW